MFLFSLLETCDVFCETFEVWEINVRYPFFIANY